MDVIRKLVIDPWPTPEGTESQIWFGRTMVAWAPMFMIAWAGHLVSTGLNSLGASRETSGMVFVAILGLATFWVFLAKIKTRSWRAPTS